MHVFSPCSSSSAVAAAMLLLLSSPVLALPQQQPANGEITVDQLIQISPDSASCDGAKYPAECATAAQAVPFINDGFAKYGITSTAEKAAIISLMMSESGDFKSNFRHDVVGQGSKLFYLPLFSSVAARSKSNPFSNTARNMQMFKFNEEYANTFPELQCQVAGILSNAPESDPGAQTAILGLVLPNKFSFGTAMWFYTNKCSPDIRSGVQTGSQEGFENYLSICVGTTLTDRVKGLFPTAKKALGIA
ncbi:hypothetical protein GP486_006616 [Trichoglossum hirsutum]|uniref:Uncharacterized protein n=1 Tax=Trichoglossum hirsutum TaxID=265104 RepID=A0A9P8L7C8_9PEZI|nr:hypothetical protein GP486_006616 [Trichoglossum hirsutum]